jgi:hypothetical protein
MQITDPQNLSVREIPSRAEADLDWQTCTLGMHCGADCPGYRKEGCYNGLE